MGASLTIRHIQAASIDELKKIVNDFVSQDTYESGHSYSGAWTRSALHFPKTEVFGTTQEAEDYIEEKHEKWEPLFAVKARQEKEMSRIELENDAVHVELLKSLRAVQSELDQQNGIILKRAKEAKSEFRGCGGCGSRISVKHLQWVKCPVCQGNLLRTATDDAQAAAMKEKLQKLQVKLQARRELLLKKKHGSEIKETIWVVGGWCSS